MTMLNIGAVDIELLVDGTVFLGLGAIGIAGTALRQARRPIRPVIDTPDGISYPQLRLREIITEGVATVVRLAAPPVVGLRREYRDEYGQQQLNLAAAADGCDDLDLILQPLEREFAGRRWLGFSYRFRFHSTAGRSIHRLLVDATWEPGGNIVGNTVLSQGQCNMPVWRGAVDTTFTTACLRTLSAFGTPQGYSFELAPRSGMVQAFDFVHGPAGVLSGEFPELASISSLLESRSGEDVLHVVDEYRFPLASTVETPAKAMWWSPGAIVEHAARDLWQNCYARIRRAEQARLGLHETTVRPEAGMLHYATWAVADRLRFRILDQECDSQEALDLLAETLLPRLAQQGVTRFFPDVMLESDPTAFGFRRKLDGGIVNSFSETRFPLATHGDQHVGSVCCWHRMRVAELWGGPAVWRRFYAKGRALGIEIGHWIAPFLSARAPIFERFPEARMIDGSCQGAAGGYGFNTLHAVDWNTPIADWVLDDLRRWIDEDGLDYLFVDSYSNLALTPVNFAAGFRTNHDAFLRFLARAQALGIRSLTVESVSAAAVGRFGLCDPRGDALDQDKAVAGQNDLAWWLGNEDMAWQLSFNVFGRRRAEADLAQAFFRLVASGSFATFEHLNSGDYLQRPWQVAGQRLMTAQSRFFSDGDRMIMPEGLGVRWRRAGVELVFCYREQVLQAPSGGLVEQVGGDHPIAPSRGPVAGRAWCVYRITTGQVETACGTVL